MNPILEEIKKIGIVPVIAIDRAEDAVPLAQALMEGGLPCAEVTFRTEAAAQAIQNITSAFPQMLVGAGTILTTEQVDQAVAVGSKFIVSPGLNPKVVSYCIHKNIPVIPGCANPSDIEIALELGLETVKFFPAEALGGIKMIKAMSAPYGNVTFMPTGGVSETNLRDYLDFPKILACGGSWMVGQAMIRQQKFAEIKDLTSKAVTSMLGFDVAHVGINASNESAAGAIGDTLAKYFGFASKVGASSIFASSGIEIMKSPYLGSNGHIAIGTKDIQRAIYHLEARGAQFDRDTAKFDENNNLLAIYLTEEVGGFSFHLVQKK